MRERWSRVRLRFVEVVSCLDAMYCFEGLFVVLVCTERRGFGVIGGWLKPLMLIEILKHGKPCSIDLTGSH